jgi:CheY-like chemotaxis protein
MPELQSKIVLIVDDDRDAADTLAILIRNDGHYVLVAYEAETGFELASTWPPDVIFHDIAMPAMNGYDAVRRLRGDARFAKTLLVAVTAYNSTHDRNMASEAGFDVHMPKPVIFQRVKELLRLPRKA